MNFFQVVNATINIYPIFPQYGMVQNVLPVYLCRNSIMRSISMLIICTFIFIFFIVLIIIMIVVIGSIIIILLLVDCCFYILLVY